MGNPLKEQWWLYRIRAKKDPEAFRAVYDQYVAQIYRFVRFKVSSDEDAKEIASDVFFKTWEYITAGKSVTNLTGLLYTIARTGTIDYYRKKRVEQVPLENVPELPDPRQSDGGTSAAHLSDVLAAIRELKDEYREALLMRHVDGLSTSEIAMALGKSVGNVRVLLHRATQALKEIVK